jgi:hypothetical protein
MNIWILYYSSLFLHISILYNFFFIIILNNYISIILYNFNFRKTFFKLPMKIPTASIRQYIVDGWKKNYSICHYHRHMPLSPTKLLCRNITDGHTDGLNASVYFRELEKIYFICHYHRQNNFVGIILAGKFFFAHIFRL